MAVLTQRHRETDVITVVGDLTGEDVHAFDRAVRDALLSRLGGAPHVVVDLQDCDYVDAEGSASLLRARRRCEAERGRLEVTNVPDHSGCP